MNAQIGVLVFFPGAVPLPAATGAAIGDHVKFSAIVRRPPGRPWANEYCTEEGIIVKITRRAYHVRRTGRKYSASWTKKDDFKILAILRRAADVAEGADA